MKLIFVSIITCFLVACSNTNAKHAPEDLCAINLGKINDSLASEAATMGEPNKTRIHELYTKAEQYQQQGNIKGCIANTEQALIILGQYDNR